MYAETKPLLQEDGVREYEVELIETLKGNPGKAEEKIKISTTEALVPGARYLLTGKPASRNGKPWLLFHWQLGVVRLPENFDLRKLEGKDNGEKIAVVLSARHAEVLSEIRKLEEEKKQIEEVLGGK